MRKAMAIACLAILAPQAFGQTSTNAPITMPGSPLGIAFSLGRGGLFRESVELAG
jgi:hypothetical protein